MPMAHVCLHKGETSHRLKAPRAAGRALVLWTLAWQTAEHSFAKCVHLLLEAVE